MNSEKAILMNKLLMVIVGLLFTVLTMMALSRTLVDTVGMTAQMRLEFDVNRLANNIEITSAFDERVTLNDTELGAQSNYTFKENFVGGEIKDEAETVPTEGFYTYFTFHTSDTGEEDYIETDNPTPDSIDIQSSYEMGRTLMGDDVRTPSFFVGGEKYEGQDVTEMTEWEEEYDYEDDDIDPDDELDDPSEGVEQDEPEALYYTTYEDNIQYVDESDVSTYVEDMSWNKSYYELSYNTSDYWNHTLDEGNYTEVNLSVETSENIIDTIRDVISNIVSRNYHDYHDPIEESEMIDKIYDEIDFDSVNESLINESYDDAIPEVLSGIENIEIKQTPFISNTNNKFYPTEIQSIKDAVIEREEHKEESDLATVILDNDPDFFLELDEEAYYITSPFYPQHELEHDYLSCYYDDIFYPKHICDIYDVGYEAIDNIYFNIEEEPDDEIYSVFQNETLLQRFYTDDELDFGDPFELDSEIVFLFKEKSQAEDYVDHIEEEEEYIIMEISDFSESIFELRDIDGFFGGETELDVEDIDPYTGFIDSIANYEVVEPVSHSEYAQTIEDAEYDGHDTDYEYDGYEI